ncbi:MAG: DUF1592 domain-containing protein [Aureliella sp.]
MNLQPFANQLAAGELDAEQLDQWIRIFDRVHKGEMPPEEPLSDKVADGLLQPLRPALVELDKRVVASGGRAVWRRMNRREYANALRELLEAPWLQLEGMLPADGERHGFNKVGEALDISHVNMARCMQAADFALRAGLRGPVDEPEVATQRFYARDQGSFNRRVHYNPFNRSPERATFPLIDYDADAKVLDDPDQPFSVGAADAALREREAFGVVASSYEPIEVQFSAFKATASGRYNLRFKGYTFWAEGESKRWWRPDRKKTSKGRRSEPVTIYSRQPPRQLRRLGDFDFDVEPSVQTLEVYLLKGETIQPDAVRLFRSRPPAWHNPLAEKDGMPGVAFQWMEAEGPLQEQWPPASRQLLFGDLPIKQAGEQILLARPPTDGEIRASLRRFMKAAYRGEVDERQVERFSQIVSGAMDRELSPTNALLAGYTAVLCSPEFLCIREPVGKLTAAEVTTRLSLFLYDSMPDQALRQEVRSVAGPDGEVEPIVVKNVAHRMLDDPRRERFVRSFLDYWLDLRRINDTSPDEVLYADYYLDDSLVDAAREETTRYFDALITDNLPVRYLVDSDFTFANERLAKHYGLPHFEGAKLRRVELPENSVRGGLLTQASVLKVTANGTTTSPVVRGTFVNERILGVKIPPPPPSVPAIEPDTRGATTIRQQLDLHRADEACNQCHKVIDPAGFALESFDVAGGFRERYRSLAPNQQASGTSNADGNLSDSTEKFQPVEGFGKNGQPFQFALGPPVDPSGQLPSGEPFADVRELKEILAAQPRQLARNLIEKFVIFATGAPVRFSDREEVEGILDELADDQFPIRSLIESVAASEMFLQK